MNRLPPANEGRHDGPLRFARQLKLSPMPKQFQAQGSHIRTLSVARQAAVLADIDAATFEIRNMVRGLPLMQRLYLAPDRFSLGYKRPQPNGNSAELYFIDPDLRLAGSFSLAHPCTGFAQQEGKWIVADREGAIRCFDRRASHLWTWRVPPERCFESRVLHIGASRELIFVAQSIHLYALAPEGRLLWEWALPNRHRQRQGCTVTVGGGCADRALEMLGLHQPVTPASVRQAYRRMARLTHPDFHPRDPLAAARFRAVREAYEAVQRQGCGDGGNAGGLQIKFSLNGGPLTAWISSLSVNEALVAAGTSEGEVWLCGHGGGVITHHTDLGQRAVQAILLSASGMQTAFCYPHLLCFGGGSSVSSDPIPEYSVQLAGCGGDSLLWGWKTMWLLDGKARVKQTRILDRRIDGVVSSATETILLSGGYLYGIPH